MRKAWTVTTRFPATTAWLASRLIVLLALATTILGGFQLPGVAGRASLLEWDSAWYLDIATHGYLAAQPGAIRFFPLWPLLARAISTLTFLPVSAVLLLLANGLALLYLHLARLVAVDLGLSPQASALVPFVLALSPAAFVTVMGYTEPLFGVLVCVVFLTVRDGRWRWCALAGLAAGALRPNGLVLAIPILIEAVRGWRTATPGARTERVVAIAAPAVGLGAFLAWAADAYGDPLAPFRAQLAPELRGAAFANPVQTIATGFATLTQGQVTDFVLHLLWIPGSLLLLVVVIRRLPASHSAFTAASLTLALTAGKFNSYERYAGAALPLSLAASLVLAGWRAWLRRTVLAVLAVSLFVHAVLAFVGWYLP